MAIVGCLLLILSVFFCGSIHARGVVKQLKENKAFIEQFGNGEFEIVQPRFENSTIVVNSRLQLDVETNEFTFSNVQGVQNCFYQGRIEGFDDSLVALSTCYGIRGVISFANGTSYGIWPLNRSKNGKAASHVLYQTRLNATLHGKGESAKKAQKFRSKFINIELDIEDITDFDQSEEKALFYFMDAANIADLITSRFMNIRLNAWSSKSPLAADARADLKVTMAAAKSLNKRDRSSFIGKVCDVSEKTAKVRVVDAPFTTHATAHSLALVVSDSIGIPLHLECSNENPFCLVGVVENRRCLPNYPPPPNAVSTTTVMSTTTTEAEIHRESHKRAYLVDSMTIVIAMSCVGAFLVILLVVLHVTYRRIAPREAKPVKDVTVEAPRRRVITFGEMPSYKSEQRRETKNKRVFEALEYRKTTMPKETDAVSIASTKGSADHQLHI